MPADASLVQRLANVVSPAATTEALFLLALAAGTLAFALAALPSLSAALSRLPAPARAGLALALVAAVLLRRFTVQGLPFHEDFHLPIVLDRIATAQDMDVAMGRGFAIVHDVLSRLFGGGEDRLYDAHRLFGAASVVLLGLVAHELLGSGLAAFAAALLLAANPIHARLSASEDPVVPAVFLLLSATAAVLLAARGRVPSPGGRPARWQPAFLVLHAASALALMVHFRSDFAIYSLVPVALALSVPGAFGRLARLPAAWAGAVLLGVSMALVLPEVLRPSHDGFRLVTRPGAFLEAVLGAWDHRQPNRLVLFCPALSPSLIPALALAGFVALFRTRRPMAWALLVPGVAFSWLLLGSNGYPGNVRHQAPQHLLFLLPAAAGAAWLITGPFASRRGRAAAAGAFVVLVALSYAATIRTLALPASPHYERAFLAEALPQVPLGPGTTLVRLEGGRDARFVNTTFPDAVARQAGARLAPVAELLQAAPEMDAESLRPYVFYRGLSCYLAAAYGRVGHGPCDNPCRLLDRAYELRPIVERDIPNVPYESMFLYPAPGDQPNLRVGFYRLLPRSPAAPAPSDGASAEGASTASTDASRSASENGLLRNAIPGASENRCIASCGP